MSYVGSYIWQIRQKVGEKRLITATVDVLPIAADGRIKIVYEREKSQWCVVGGHVEEGGTWLSAALNELHEEAGIVAKREDLVPWAASSGVREVTQYADGSTQPFTLVFLVRKWESESRQRDEDEISDTKWVAVDEALGMEISPRLRRILVAYKEYLETGEFQMIEEEI
jgi:8-oxo-dGTP pyrophosphatase MutT (NUDIX family)